MGVTYRAAGGMARRRLTHSQKTRGAHIYGPREETAESAGSGSLGAGLHLSILRTDDVGGWPERRPWRLAERLEGGLDERTGLRNEFGGGPARPQPFEESPAI